MKLIIIVLVLIAAYIQYNNAKEESHARVKRAYIEYSNSNTFDTNKISNSNKQRNSVGYTCDGRTHCSQMSSCAEATYFLNNCPNTEMDGDYDGIPCERQWC